MSTIAYTSGQIERKQQLLDTVNRAVMVLQADAIGLREPMRLDDAMVAKSRETAERFLEAIVRTLEGRTGDPLIASVVQRLHARPDARHASAVELQSLRNALLHGVAVDPHQLVMLSELLRVIDREFTEDLYRLYGRR